MGKTALAHNIACLKRKTPLSWA